MEGCLDDNAIAAYFDGTLPESEIARVDTHIDQCATCRSDLSAMAVAHSADAIAAGSGEVDHDLGELVPGNKIGRYVLKHEHARGGMGVVAVAYDPELGRNVAIKVLRAEVTSQLGPGAEHLREEARAMASLSHPNVVSVHDVGEHEGQLFLAMELVDGVSLRAWLAVERRSWRTIVRTCIRAGAGLAAAHRAGLVHRDFKPDNVLCGPEDRVRVTDFGLARRDGIAVRGGVRTGVAGTPRYMAPEVWRGEPATARSDQWSFCVTLYQALFGKLPFEAESARELGMLIRRGTFAMPARRGVPARVTRVITRGLRVDPGERFASIDELLAELEAALHRSSAVWIAAAIAAVVILGGLGINALRRGDGPECTMPRSLLDGAWDAGRRTSIETAFAASGRKHAATTARRVGEILDRYGEHWLAAREEACVATRVRGDQSDVVLDARSRCLDRRLSELSELTRVFADRPTPQTVDRAVQAALELYPVETCSATGVRTEQPLPVTPDRAALIIELDRELAALRASQLVKRVDATAERARSIVERARPLGYAPLSARAAYQLAMLAKYSNDHAAAERTFFDALAAAAAAHDDRLAAAVWVDLVSFAAMQKGDAALALTFARAAEIALVRVDSPGHLRSAFHHGRGTAFAMSGKHEEARKSYEQSLAESPGTLEVATTNAALCGVEVQLGKIDQANTRCGKAVATLETELGPNHPMVGFTLISAGNVATQRRDFDTARGMLVRALAILADTVGERHLAFALALNNLGMIEERTEDIVGARRDYKRALELLDTMNHPDAFTARVNLGNLELRVGNLEEARAHWEKGLAIAEATHGKDSDRAATIWLSFGALEVDLDHLDKAEVAYRRSLAIAEKLYGENHPKTAEALDGLGFVFRNRKQCARAILYQQRAVAVNEAVYGPGHPRVAETLTTLGDCQMSLGDRAALANLERALAIHDRHPSGAPFEPAATRWTFAKALVKLGGDKARAVTLAKEARALYAKSSDIEAARVLPTIDRWIAARR